MDWRPEGYRNPYEEYLPENQTSLFNMRTAYDAGLEAFVKWAESIQDNDWLNENPTLGMCLSLDCWSVVGGGARARNLFDYNKLKLTLDEETKT